METQTQFHENGDIDIFPASFELGRNDVAPGKAKYRARIEVAEDGTTKVRMPSNKAIGSRYLTIFATDHGSIRVTKGGITKRRRLVVQFRFPNSCSQAEINLLFGNEYKKMEEYLQNNKTTDIWKED
ncbi:MAG: hypothetical protein PUD15_00670 [Prevotella sp.]|nr:hypothetical protein [Prevotella sp.]